MGIRRLRKLYELREFDIEPDIEPDIDDEFGDEFEEEEDAPVSKPMFTSVRSKLGLIRSVVFDRLRYLVRQWRFVEDFGPLKEIKFPVEFKGDTLVIKVDLRGAVDVDVVNRPDFFETLASEDVESFASKVASTLDKFVQQLYFEIAREIIRKG